MLEIGRVLDANAQLVCKRLGESKIMASSFYLAGGTALALQLGHRRLRAKLHSKGATCHEAAQLLCPPFPELQL